MAKAIGYMKPDIDPNMRLYVPFNEGVGSIAKDYSQYGNHAQLTDVEWSPDGFNGAGKFNGSSSYGDCGNNASLNITDAITIEAWVKTTSASLGEPVAKGDYRYLFYYHGDRAVKYMSFQVFLTNAGWTDSGKATLLLGDGNWHHIAGTFDGTQSKYYQDGALEQTITRAADTITSDDNPLTIGSRYDGTNPFNGTIDNVRIYNRALSAPQIPADCYEVVCN